MNRQDDKCVHIKLEKSSKLKHDSSDIIYKHICQVHLIDQQLIYRPKQVSTTTLSIMYSASTVEMDTEY